MNVTLDIDYEMDIEKPRKDNVQVTYDFQPTMVDQKVINCFDRDQGNDAVLHLWGNT